MRFLFLFTFHQLVDAWRKFANSASKVIIRAAENVEIGKELPGKSYMLAGN